MRFKSIFSALFLASFLTFSPLRAELHPIAGPGVGNLGNVAQVKIPDGYIFYEQKDMKEFMEKSQNLYSSDQLGILSNPNESSGYLVLFSFDDIGYIKDAEKENLDADKMWSQMLEGEKEENKARAEKGWAEMHLVAWALKPQYNSQTQRLEWAESFKEGERETINYNTRILGRKGVMRATLVPFGDLQAVLPGFNETITGFDFTSGNKYAEWTTGDKVADIGLAALVIGGAGALAAKTGLLGKFWGLILLGLAKAGKLLLVGFVVLAGFFKKILGIGKKKDVDPPSSLVK